MIFLAQITGRTNLKFMRHQFVNLFLNRNISKSLVTSSYSVEHSKEEVEDKTEKVRIVFISDTHSDHTKLGKLPDGEILVHAGKNLLSHFALSGSLLYLVLFHIFTFSYIFIFRRLHTDQAIQTM